MESHVAVARWTGPAALSLLLSAKHSEAMKHRLVKVIAVYNSGPSDVDFSWISAAEVDVS
eukprot:14893446-Alexandrium_andersonii.AAC.1